jgi:hypothetical protein
MLALAARGLVAAVVIAVSFMGYKWYLLSLWLQGAHTRRGLDYLLEHEKGRSKSRAADARQLDIMVHVGYSMESLTARVDRALTGQ